MKIEHLSKWDRFGIEQAKLWGSLSKDPSTQVGAYIADVLNRPVSGGYNGFPRLVKDTPERLHNRGAKYPRMVHAELNAILNARVGVPEGSSLYVWPLCPCAVCAGAIIQSGLTRVIAAVDPKRRAYDDSYTVMRSMFTEAGVTLIEAEF